MHVKFASYGEAAAPLVLHWPLWSNPIQRASRNLQATQMWRGCLRVLVRGIWAFHIPHSKFQQALADVRGILVSVRVNIFPDMDIDWPLIENTLSPLNTWVQWSRSIHVIVLYTLIYCFPYGVILFVVIHHQKSLGPFDLNAYAAAQSICSTAHMGIVAKIKQTSFVKLC